MLLFEFFTKISNIFLPYSFLILLDSPYGGINRDLNILCCPLFNLLQKFKPQRGIGGTKRGIPPTILIL